MVILPDFRVDECKLSGLLQPLLAHFHESDHLFQPSSDLPGPPTQGLSILYNSSDGFYQAIKPQSLEIMLYKMNDACFVIVSHKKPYWEVLPESTWSRS